jgi:hypothetical protein
MENHSTEASRRHPLRVRIKVDVAYMITAAIMAVMGTLFSTAAFAAGVKQGDVLAMLFVMGAAGALLILLLWYLAQLYAR